MGSVAGRAVHEGGSKRDSFGYGSVSGLPFVCNNDDDDANETGDSGNRRQSLRWMSSHDVLKSLKQYQPYSPTSRRHSTSHVPARAVPIGCEPKIALAALYVKEAMECSEPRVYRDQVRPLRSHKWRYYLVIPRWVAIVALLTLSFIEEPRWCRDEPECFSHYKYPSWEMKAVHWRASQGYEAFCLLVLAADLLLWVDVLGMKQFVAWRTRLLHASVLLVSALDLLVSLVASPTAFRLSPYLRITFLMFYSTPLRRELTSLANSLPTLMKVIFLYFMYTAIFAWFGAVLFPYDSVEGKLYFPTFGVGLWSLAVLLTTNNSPDVFIPAVESERLYFFFFFFFLIGGLFFFTNLITAVMYTGYTEGKTQDEVEMMVNREHAIDGAFNCVAVSRDPVSRERVINADTMELLYVELSKDFSLRHLASPEVRVLFHLLDTTGSHTITRSEFRRLPGLLNCELSKVDDIFIERFFPTLWHATWFHALRQSMTSVPNFPAVTINVPYFDPVAVICMKRDFSVHIGMRWASAGSPNASRRSSDRGALPEAQEDSHNLTFSQKELDTVKLVSERSMDKHEFDRLGPLPNFDASLPECPYVNFELDFSMQPSLRIISDRVKQIASDAAKPFKLSAAYIYDESEQTWGPLLSACQLFHSCQIFLSGEDREYPPAPRNMPCAVTLPEFLHSISSELNISDGGSSVSGIGPRDYNENDRLLQKKRKGNYYTNMDKDKNKKFLRWAQFTFLPPTSSWFDLFVDCVVVVNGVLTVIETWHFLEGGASSLERYSWQNTVDFAFITFYVLEAFIKLGILGVKSYFKSLQNRFDFLVMILCVVAALVVLAPNGYDNPKLLKFLVMGRMFRLLRILAFSSWYSVFIRTLMSSLPKASHVALLQFSIMYLFVTLGLDLFGGVINRDPDSADYKNLVSHNTSYATGEVPWVAVLNFNDMASGFVLLFACLVMNNWDQYVLGFSVTTSNWARCYFEAFWIFGVLVGLNLVTSLLLDFFKEEWDRARSDTEVRKDPSDGLYKTREDFIAAGFTTNDWLTAERKDIDGVDAIVKEAREGGWVIDAQHLTGEKSGDQYVLRFRGDETLLPDADGNQVYPQITPFKHSPSFYCFSPLCIWKKLRESAEGHSVVCVHIKDLPSVLHRYHTPTPSCSECADLGYYL